MEGQGPEITFMFQFGLIRDAVTVSQSSLTLKTIKNLACDFLNSKVNIPVLANYLIHLKMFLDTRSWH